MSLKTKEHNVLGEVILFSQLVSVDVASEESVKKLEVLLAGEQWVH
ncbi:hypothetical protein [Shewanella frigidimarina]